MVLSGRLLGIEEAAELLSVSVRTMRYWRETGEGPTAARFGRRLVYREADVLVWVDERFAAAERERRGA